VTTIRPRIEEIISGPPHHILTVSILGAIWTSSSAIEAIRGMLNRAYRVRKPPAYFSRRLMSIAQVILLTALILTIMLIFVFVPIALKGFTHVSGLALPSVVEHFFSTFFKPMAAIFLFGMIACMYYVLPNIKQRWLAVAPGALLVVVLSVVAASLVSFYLNDVSQMNVIYGSLSGFIATLIFFYVMHVIFIYGAEFNHELMVMLGQRIEEREQPESPGIT